MRLVRRCISEEVSLAAYWAKGRDVDCFRKSFHKIQLMPMYVVRFLKVQGLNAQKIRMTSASSLHVCLE